MAGAVKEIPQYLEKYYWWAYARPWAAKLFDHQFMVNAILLGNYNRLRDEAVKELGDDFSGRTLQVGCCYGNLTPYLAKRAAKSGGECVKLKRVEWTSKLKIEISKCKMTV